MHTPQKSWFMRKGSRCPELPIILVCSSPEVEWKDWGSERRREKGEPRVIDGLLVTSFPSLEVI